MNTAIERYRTAVRALLIYEAVTIGAVSLWILIAPRGFYDDFPVGSSAWVSALPPFNEHLIRDFGSAGLGLAVLAGLAALWMDRRLVQAAAIAIFAGSLPHTIYHFTTTEAYSSGDNVASLGGLVVQTVIPLAVIYMTRPAAEMTTGAPTPKEA
jgi:hypothetical protein